VFRKEVAVGAMSNVLRHIEQRRRDRMEANTDRELKRAAEFGVKWGAGPDGVRRFLEQKRKEANSAYANTGGSATKMCATRFAASEWPTGSARGFISTSSASD